MAGPCRRRSSWNRCSAPCRVLQGRGRVAPALERTRHPQGAVGGLADKGFGREALADMQKVIQAESSDLFDVLAYVAFAVDPVTRADRAAAASAATAAELPDRQQTFVDFVLAQYVKQGVDELDAEKLSPLLRLRYQALSDAFADLGQPDQVRRLFVGFQRSGRPGR
jgi:type I restriction enzyme R subunit